MKLCCSFLLAVMALCVFADDPATKSLKDYETELRREFPFVEHKKGDKVAFVIDNGETKVSGTVVRVNAKGVMIEDDGVGILYSINRLPLSSSRLFYKEKYEEWIASTSKQRSDEHKEQAFRNREREQHAKEEKEKLERDKYIVGLDGYSLGDELKPGDIIAEDTYDFIPVKPKDSTFPANTELSVLKTKAKSFIYRIRFSGSTLNGARIIELYGAIRGFIERYPNAVKTGVKTLPGADDIPIEGQYRYEYEGRVITLEFKISNLAVYLEQTVGDGFVTVLFEDDVLLDLDSAYRFYQKKELTSAKRILDDIFRKYPFKKNDSQYTVLSQKVEAELKAEDEKLAREQKAQEDHLNANPVKIKYDRMEKITWYETARDTEEAFYRGYKIEPYFGKHDNGTFILRVRTRFEGRSWVFYERVKLLGDNDTEVEFFTEYPQKKSEVYDGGEVVEWSDDNLTAQSGKLSELAKSKSILVKFYGKYSREFEMTPKQLRIFKEVMAKYQSL